MSICDLDIASMSLNSVGLYMTRLDETLVFAAIVLCDCARSSAVEIIRVFNDYDFDYVIIGAFAVQAYNTPAPLTYDINFTPSCDPDNIARLDSALHAFESKMRIDTLDTTLRQVTIQTRSPISILSI